MSRVERTSLGIILAAVASPALAGTTPGVPAPVVGVGVGAVLLVGVGYRALKARIRR